MGDVNLWNMEQPKSLEVVKEQLNHELDNIDTNAQQFQEASEDRRVNITEGIIKLLSGRIKEIRHHQLQIKKRLSYNLRKNEQSGLFKRYQYAISACKTYLYSTYLWVNKAVANIGDLAAVNAMIHGSFSQLQLHGKCDLASKSNV